MLFYRIKKRKDLTVFRKVVCEEKDEETGRRIPEEREVELGRGYLNEGKFPKSWAGEGDWRHLVNTADRVREQVSITGEGDPRWPASKLVLNIKLSEERR